MADTDFYRAFEDRYRGSRELIKSRLAVYLPFVLPLKQCYGICQGVDLGCGRGEWLELMQENKIDVLGVDLDQGMLDAARELGLKVDLADAIKTLQALGDDSQMLVSGFHLVEHMPFERLQTLMQESFRVLKPGGILILETPNPENIMVGTWGFYLDPTHQRPIPAHLLLFMADYYGFSISRILRLQESKELADSKNASLIDVLNGVSPDYAVVAQKGGHEQLTAAIAPVFAQERGLTLEQLANRYDSALRAAETECQKFESALWAKETERQKIESALWAKETERQKIESALWAKEAELARIQNSFYWRLGKPIRALVNLLKKQNDRKS